MNSLKVWSELSLTLNSKPYLYMCFKAWISESLVVIISDALNCWPCFKGHRNRTAATWNYYVALNAMNISVSLKIFLISGWLYTGCPLVVYGRESWARPQSVSLVLRQLSLVYLKWPHWSNRRYNRHDFNNISVINCHAFLIAFVIWRFL